MRNQSWLAAIWLVAWGTAVAAQRVREWWVVLFAGALLVALTKVVGRLPIADRLSLKPVSGKVLLLGTAAGGTLFLLFYLYLRCGSLPLTGHVSAPLIVWSVLIAPVSEELVFRGLLYRTVQSIALRLRTPHAVELIGVILIAVVFGALHQRSSIFLAMTIAAGLLYGLIRWRFGSVQPSIACHISYNALALLFLAR